MRTHTDMAKNTLISRIAISIASSADKLIYLSNTFMPQSYGFCGLCHVTFMLVVVAFMHIKMLLSYKCNNKKMGISP